MDMDFSTTDLLSDESSLLDVAKEYIAAGVSIIPIKLDGTKRPAIKSWNKYREQFATRGELIAWYYQPKHGIAIVCGVQSGGLEVIDFDHNAEENFHKYCRMIPADFYGRLCAVETGGGGYHVIYRSMQVSGNHKIAMSADGKQTLIETRGEGGYIVAVGSPVKVHASGNRYVQVLGRPLPELPVFTPEERKTLWQVAATFDQRDPEAVRAEYVKRRVRELREANPQPIDCDKPWDDFDSRADWAAILGPHGWTTTDGVNWARPGKSGGSSGKLNRNSQGVVVLTVFSNNAAPLVAGSYGPFNAFKILHHNGDPSAAAKAIRAMGYGKGSR